MANQFYNYSGNFIPGTLARAETVSAEFNAVAQGFARLSTQGIDTGLVNAYVVTTTGYPVAAYQDGNNVEFEAIHTNTGPSTIAVNGLPAVPLLRFNGNPLVSGDVVAGAWYICIYTALYGGFTIVSPTAYATFAGTISLAPPTQLVGLTSAGGASSAAAPIDATWAIDQSIAPTWTGLHTFNGKVVVGAPASGIALAVAGNTANVAVSILTNMGTKAAGIATLRVGTAAGTEAGWTNNPAAGDFVTIYSYNSSNATRNRIWAENPVIDITSGNPATGWGMEVDVNQGNANSPDPHNTNHAIGIDIVSGGTFAPSAGLSVYGTSAANRWKHGIWLDYIGGQSGSTLIAAGKATSGTTVTVDHGIDFSVPTFNFQGIRVGATPATQAATIGARQFSNGSTNIFLQRFTDTTPTGNLIQAVNAANNAVIAALDASGNYTGTQYVANPASGTVGLVVNGAASTGQQISIIGSSGNGATILYTDGNAGNRVYIVGVSVTTVGAFEVFDNSGGVSRLKITNAGNFTIAAPSSGVALTVTGVSGTHSTKIADSATNVFNAGFLEIPQVSKSINYTTVLSDSGKHIYHPSADTTARTWTIDSNANVAYPIGTAITFDNDTSAGVITLAITSDTLVWLPSGTTGSRSIAANGQATALKVTATRWHLTGVGIT